jgi:SAM-dependent methyltransferase
VTGWDPATYGERFAPVYDNWYGNAPDTDAAVETLASLASVSGGRRILELGVGTGRLALPLAARGFDVHGIDASRSMVERLRAKPGGDGVTVTVADFATVPVDGAFDLVFVAYNTLFNLPTPEAQRSCLAAVADRLVPDGRFVVEAFVPDPARHEREMGVEVRGVELDRVLLHVFRHEPADRTIVNQTVVLAHGQPAAIYPARLRYASPEELDAMAADAGLVLRQRWAGWDRQPYLADASPIHVSMYGRA